jgi:hypothetical protein
MIIIAMGPDPFDPDKPLLEIDCRHEAVRIPLDIEYDSLRTYDAGGCVRTSNLDGVSPARPLNLIEPGV